VGLIRSTYRNFLWIYRNGIINGLLRIIQYRKFDTEIIIGSEHQGTSITDGEYTKSWPTMAQVAAAQDKIFRKFRRSRVLIDALDHVTLEDAKKYFSEIEKISNFQPKFRACLKDLDSVGKPVRYYFRSRGVYSPTVIRYLKVYLDLHELFGNLDNFKIAEIGIGFGGQASVVSNLSNPKSYALFDLPSVLDLSRKVLSKNNSQCTFEYFDGRKPTHIESDLVISNYAFSELNKDVQKIYLERVILKAKRGYITWNNLSEKQLGGFSVADLIREIPNSEILPEVPLTYPGNCIIYWKNL
jgi:putative sugar O-methyltransferase